MHSFLRQSLSVACLSLAWIPTAQSTPSGQKWIPRNVDMQNMVVDLGMGKFGGSGSACKLQDFSNEPVLSFTNVQQNQTYLAAALSLLVDTPITSNSSESGTFDPAKVLQESSRSPIYLSYLQTSMHKRATASTILSSEVDPLVPFKLPAISSCGQSIVFIAFVLVQPHPLLVEDCYTRDFSAMKDDITKRGDYNFAEFWKSAALGDILAATWITIGNDKAGCSNGEGKGDGTNTEGEGVQIISVTTDSVSPSGATAEAAIGATDETITITTTITADGKLTVITPTTATASSLVGGENGAFVGGRIGQESPAINASNEEAVITSVISTTDKDGKPTIITTTVSSATAAAAVASPSSSQITGSGENGKQDEKLSNCDSTTTTTTTTTTTATSTITRAGNNPPPIVASASREPPSESGPFITSVKTTTLTTTNAQGSLTTEIVTTTVTSTVLNLQAPGGGTAGAVKEINDGLVNGDGGFVNGTAAPSRSSQPPPLLSPLRSSTTLLLATTTTNAFTNNNNVTGTTSTTPGAGKISALPSSSSPSQPPPVQAGAADTQPTVMMLSACLLGSLGMIYFAFL